MVTAHTRLVYLLFVGLGAAAPRARAQPDAPPPGGPSVERKNAKRTTVEVEAVERRFTKPQTLTAGGQPAQPVKLEEFLQDRKKRSKRITDIQIRKMQSLIAITDETDPQKPDFFFRAGELYRENQRFFFDQAHALDQTIFQLDRKSTRLNSSH